MDAGPAPKSRLRTRVRTIIKSLGVGAVATLVDLVTLTILVSVIHLSPRIGSFPAFAAGIAVQFLGNKLFAFQDRSKRWGSQAILFLGVEMISLLGNLVLFDFAVRWVPLPYLALRLVTTNVVYFTVSLPLWSRVFRTEKESIS